MRKVPLHCLCVFVLLAGLLLAGCGGDSEPTAPAPEGEATTAAPATATGALPTEPPAAPPTATAPPTSAIGGHIEKGAQYFAQGDYARAVAEFEAAVALEPDNPAALSNLGAAYAEQGRWDEALAALQEAIALDPDDAYAQANLCRAYTGQDRLEEALAACQEALRLDAEISLVHNALGNIYTAQGALDEAAREYREAIRLDPEDPWPHYNLGNYYRRVGQMDQAIAKWQEAVQIDPDHALAHLNLGLAYQMWGQVEASLAEFETYLQLEPDSSQRAGVEGEIARQRQLQDLLAEEHYEPYGGYRLRHPADFFPEEGNTGVLLLSPDEGPETAPLFGVVALPLTNQGEGRDLSQVTTVEEFAQVAAPRYDIDPEGLAAFALSGQSALIADWQPVLGGAQKVGKIIFSVGRGMGYVVMAVAQAEDAEIFEPIGLGMAGSLALVEPPLAQEYQSEAGGVSLRYPEGWAVDEGGGFVSLTPAEGLNPHDAPYVAIFAGAENIASAFGVQMDLTAENVIAAFVWMLEADAGQPASAQVGGQPATAVDYTALEDGVEVAGRLVVLPSSEPPLAIVGTSPASQWEFFAPTFVAMMDSVELGEAVGASPVDWSDPASVLQAVFRAARTQDFALLPGLCDPLGQNDGDTALICEITADHAEKERFVEYFSPGKISGQPAIEGDQGRVPFLFGPGGDQEETMSLIRRQGKWYLFDF